MNKVYGRAANTPIEVEDTHCYILRWPESAPESLVYMAYREIQRFDTHRMVVVADLDS